MDARLGPRKVVLPGERGVYRSSSAVSSEKVETRAEAATAGLRREEVQGKRHPVGVTGS